MEYNEVSLCFIKHTQVLLESHSAYKSMFIIAHTKHSK